MEKNKLDKEIILGAIFGIIAIIAIICEMSLGGFSKEAIAGGVKDISGTIVAVLVFIIAASGIRKKNVKGFGNVFRTEMDKVIAKYDPAIVENKDDKKDSYYRCDIASKLDCIGGNASGAYHLFFRVDNEKEVKSISFKVTQTVFGDFKGEVAESVIAKLLLIYRDYIEKSFVKGDEVVVEFSKSLSSDEEAILLANIVDCVLLVCVAKYGAKK